MNRIAAAALCAVLQACATAPAGGPATSAAMEQRAPVTILVSIDAFKPDYLGKGDTPNLDALAAAGVSGTMKPVFPALTFPAHTAMTTGLYPDHSGIVAGSMYDPRRPGVKFVNSDATQVYDSFWWDGAEPLWVTAEKAGIRTGVMFWPGVEVAHDGVRASDWAHYDANYLGDARIRTILDWMRRPADIRPKLALAYIDLVDKTAHKKGPTAPESIAAVRTADGWIGALVTGLKALGQPANLIVVSDHGMQDVDQSKTLLIGSILPEGSYRFAQYGPFGAIDAMPGHEAEVATALLSPHPFVKCWRKGELPARFHYGANARVAQFICVAEAGGEIVAIPPTNKGDHGYDPDDPAMTATFIAAGPAFRRGAPLPPRFENVDVYPLLRRLIGLPPATGIDGSDAPFRAVLKQ